MTEEEKKNNNTKETSWTCRLKSQTCCTQEKKEKKRYCATKNSQQNSLWYSLQNSLQNRLQNRLQCNQQYSLQYSNMELMSMALVHLLSLPLVFAYFLHKNLLRLQTKNKSMKNKINHQNDVACFRSNDGKNPIQ